MTPSVEITAIVILAALLAVASALAGVFWSRSRSRTRRLIDVAHLADTLAERLRSLDALLAQLESARGGASDVRPGPAAGPGAGRPPRRSPEWRVDRAEPSALGGPTLITVPDLSTPQGEPAAAVAELARRFGAIWELAETGASAESIARGTGQPIGQVELILGLRRQLESVAAGSGSPAP